MTKLSQTCCLLDKVRRAVLRKRHLPVWRQGPEPVVGHALSMLQRLLALLLLGEDITTSDVALVWQLLRERACLYVGAVTSSLALRRRRLSWEQCPHRVGSAERTWLQWVLWRFWSAIVVACGHTESPYYHPCHVT